MNTELNSRLQKISGFVQTYLKESYQNRSDEDKANLDRYLSNAEYRWKHTLRVAQFGKVIAENEAADVELIVAACLLHDVGWFDTNADNSREHGRIGAEKARPVLESLGYNQAQIENICYAVAIHVDEDNPDTLEAKILSDADNVDRFGPYRILQWCFADIEDYDKLAAKLSERIHRLEHYREENPLFTTTGQQLFAEQLTLQIRFFSEFVGENELSVMPRI
ncbi:MAG: HD domain-containing protein [Chloroflexi bacterium]|nr:HD domain-containing protein [Chloroflexota bacterium]MCX6038274.1 HD domain-containing protein [Chloroflexota bacterium]